MNRPARLVTAVLTASAALLLTGCSSGGGGGSDGNKISGADAGGKSSASPSAGPSDTAGRPEIKLPSDVNDTFTPEETGDSVKDAILRDNAGLIRALDAAIVAQNPRLPALAFYTDGEGAVAAQQWVQSFTKVGWTVTGTTRYFNRAVKVKSQTSAAIGYCADESKAYSKIIKTGQVQGTKVTKDSYVAYSAEVAKNKQGIWQLVKITSTRGAAGCQP